MMLSRNGWTALLATVLIACSQGGDPAAEEAALAEAEAPGVDEGFFAVQPMQRQTEPVAAGESGELRIGQGNFFAYAMPPDWRVAEDGQYALTLVAPDNNAVTVMVGNAGLPPGYPPGQFVQEKLLAMQPQALQLGEARAAQPLSGFGEAYAFEVRYTVRGIPSRGVAKVHIATAYDTALMVMTLAAAAEDQWQGYAPWLPQVAEQISATSGAAFGVRGIMTQNIQNSTAYGEALARYRDWSQQTQRQVVSAREASVDRRNVEFREALAGVETYTNPYGTPPVELPTTYQYFWTDRQGNIVGTNDPSANPNTGSTEEWRKMERLRPDG
jgi:hypothetical protein